MVSHVRLLGDYLRVDPRRVLLHSGLPCLAPGSYLLWLPLLRHWAGALLLHDWHVYVRDESLSVLPVTKAPHRETRVHPVLSRLHGHRTGVPLGPHWTRTRLIGSSSCSTDGDGTLRMVAKVGSDMSLNFDSCYSLSTMKMFLH